MKNVNLDVEVRMLRITPSHKLLGGSSWLRMGIDQTIHLACVLSHTTLGADRQVEMAVSWDKRRPRMRTETQKWREGSGFLFCLTGDYHNWSFQPRQQCVGVSPLFGFDHSWFWPRMWLWWIFLRSSVLKKLKWFNCCINLTAGATPDSALHP